MRASAASPIPAKGISWLPPVVGRLVPPTLPAGFTFNVNWVEFVSPPPEPKAVTVTAPTGVENEVAIVRVLVKVGTCVWGLNEQVAPVGRGPQDRRTNPAVPLSSVTVMVFDPSPPWTTAMLFEFDILKSNVDWLGDCMPCAA